MILLLLSFLCLSLVDLIFYPENCRWRAYCDNKQMSSFCVHVKSSNYNTHVESVNCVDKFLPWVLNIPTFSHVNLHIQMSSSVALSLDISPFVAWYLDCRGNDGYMWSFVKHRHRDVRLCTIMCVQTSGISYEKGQITQILCR